MLPKTFTPKPFLNKDLGLLKPGPKPSEQRRGAENVSPIDESSIDDLPQVVKTKGNQPNARKIGRVQDGLSLGEWAVYSALYEAGKPKQGQTVWKVQIGYHGISTLAGRLAPTNVRLNLRSLIEKGVVEITNGHTEGKAKTYAVYSYEAILAKWQSRGLTHVIKGKGATLVSRSSIHESSIDGQPKSRSSIDGTRTASIDDLCRSSIDGTSTILDRRRDIETEARRLLQSGDAATPNERAAARAVLGLPEPEDEPKKPFQDGDG